MMKVFQINILISYAMIQLLLVNGNIQSSCSDIPIVEVKTQNGTPEPIPNNATIYRPINAMDFAMTCQCDNYESNIIPSWSFPIDSTLADLFGSNTNKCLDNRTCIMSKTLSFPSLKKEYSGYYRCHGNSNYTGFMLRVIGLPIILKPQMTREVPLKGLSVTLECRATGEGSLNYYWEKENSGNWITVNRNNITSYSATTSGQYRCNVTNEFGSVLSPVITVYGPPHFLTHPISHTVTVGMSVTLYCNVSGYKVSYGWERSADGRAWSMISNTQSYKYKVKNIQQSQQYRCVVGNMAGTFASNMAIIQVLKIVTHPHNERFKIGSSGTLTCRSSISSSDVTFTWTHNGTVISNHQVAYSYTSSLVITNVQYSNIGSYACIVAKGSLSVTSDTATITVYVAKPVIKTNPSNAKVIALTSVTFTCSASNINGVTHSFSWHRNNGDIPNSRSTGQSTNTITITRVTPLDEGMYYCTVINDAGSASSRHATLTVDDELSISVSPLKLTVSEGEVATFTATGSGIKTKAFRYQWYKVKGSNIILVGRNKQLIIDNVRIKDNGNYYCNITNQWKKRKTSELVQLAVNATSSTFTTDPHDQFVNINEDAVFVCAANGSESLTIKWTRNNVHVASSNFRISNEITNDERRSVLTVKRSTIRDSGLYRCVATNADSEISSKPAELLILPSINTHPNSITILTGQSVNLRCSAFGINVTYQWMRNGVIISDDNSFVLTINEIRQSDDGIYQCIASNKGGNATSNPAMITVYDNPTINPLQHQTLGVLDEQFQITCNATNDKDAPHNMMFTWMTPDGVDYNVNMTSEDDDHSELSTLYISRLARSDNGTYKCYVTNNNVSNASIFTSTTVIVEERPPQPLNFYVTSQNTTSLKLSWSESENVNDEINYYIIYYSDGKRIETVNVFNFTGSYVLTNLTPSTQYRIHVRSVRFTGINNETLESISSMTVNAATLDDPSAAQSGSSVTGITMGVVATLILVIIIITLILVVYFWKRKGHLKHKLLVNTITTNNSLDLKEKAFGDEAMKPIPVKHESPSSINNTDIMPVIDMTYSIEVHTSAGQPTTLLLEVPDVIEENVTWFKDGEPSTHPLLKDGSLLISHTKLSDQGEYAAMIGNNDASSKAYTVMVVDIGTPLDVNGSYTVIKVEDFPEHVSLLKSGDKSNLNAEYESLKVNAPFTQYAAKMPINIAKNRYKNIVAYDHSRVVLSQEKYIAGEDYINASFIDGYGEKKAYIASQGPMKTNLEDFWRMIWEQNVKTVVMLSRLVEDSKFKCHQYWPDSGSKLYGNIKVTAENEVQFASYCVRRFSIEHVSGSNIRKHKVHQFHFSSWPDHGVPTYATAILDFQKRIDKHHKRRTSSPMLVHCSAGVGRTGTFIAIDTEIQRIRQEGVVNVHNCVQKMRYWRNSMIQTLPQYEFVYTALLEFIICGDTSFAGAETLKQKVAKLSAIDNSVNKTGFQLQFEKLNDTSPKESDFQYTVANSNKKKNRQQKFLPPNSSRVILTDKCGYINACFINGYRHSKAFLVGPGPMKSTVVDFWQMIWENNCYAIVMLGQLQENKKETSFKYWPNMEERTTFGNFFVELVSDDPGKKSVIRHIMKVTNSKEKSSSPRTITLLQYQDWTSQSCPDNPSCIINLTEELDCVQRKTGNNAIAVHCSDGVGRSGTFCALFNCVNRFKAEQVVDVFQMIRSMRDQNPAVVQTAEQYEFIHQVLVVLTERYDTYANFTVL